MVLNPDLNFGGMLMKKFSFALVLSGVALMALGACDHQPSTKSQLEAANGQYWQRAETTSAIWQRGPKAQQTLHRDIAHCTTEIKELQRLGALRAQTPAEPDANGNMPKAGTPESKLAAWDTPERDGYLYAEHSNYHDFETCMQAGGWERVEYLPYDVATEARETYIDTILTEKRRTRSGEYSRAVEQKGDFDSLND